MKTNRRMFLKGATCASAPFILPSHIWAAETGPNDRIVMGCIGMGTQLRGLMNGFIHQDGVQVVAVCDVNTTLREDAQRIANEYYAKNPAKGTADVKGYNDFREVIARKDINAIVIATPDHWHAIQTVAALNAGKDVYCEKPLTHNVNEAIEVIRASEKNKRIVQTGSMQRSSIEFRVACELARNGAIGKIKHVVASFGGPARPYDKKEAEEMEPGIDWNMWLGPAQMAPYSKEVCPPGIQRGFPNWRGYREFGGGGVTDWGAHHLDIAHWGLGMDQSGPVEIVPVEGKHEAELTYSNGIKVYHKGGFGCEFHGEDGVVRVNRGRFTFTRGEEKVAWFNGNEDEASKGTSCHAQVLKAEKEYLADAKVKLYATKGDHLRDFITCMRSREQPCTNAETGGRTAIACNLLNQAYYNKTKIVWDPKALKLGAGCDPKWLTRDYRAPFKV
ncbi:MAG: Gfo/Idh/MocA family oxidoreductase [Kiritimatiellaeota bacterium]|nr:Gfo/Idh/MocA family oxidoreductase [Kiritimatiellota bacterium]